MSGLRLDPRASILLLLCSFFPPICFNSPLPSAAVFAAYLVVALIASGPGGLRAAALLLTPLLLSSALLWGVFLGEGEVLFRLGPLAWRDVSVWFGLAMGLRFGAWSLAGLTFLARVTVEEMAWGLHRLGLPYPAAFSLSLSLRLARQFSDTARMVVEAQRVRGLDLEGGSLPSRVGRLAPTLVPLLVLSLRRVNQMAMAMESRGYGGGPRTSWLDFRWRNVDTGLLLGGVALTMLCIGLRWYGVGVLLNERL